MGETFGEKHGLKDLCSDLLGIELDKEKQISSFIRHIEASIKTNAPLIIHSRNAEKETYDILNDYKDKNLKILMHCFTGSKKFSVHFIF